MSTESDPGFESGLLMILSLPDRCQNAVDSLPCRRQSFLQV